MPVYDVDAQPPGGSYDPEPSDTWSMPVGRIADVRFYLCYEVFVAFAVLAGLVAMVQSREGNGDLPIVTATAISIWCCGWLVQALVQLCLHFGTHAKSDAITIGLLGVQISGPLHRRHPWSAISNLASALLTWTALFLFGFGCLVIHFISRSVVLTDWSRWVAELTAPSFGMDALENCYLTAAWLFWIQAACQAYPLPRNLGRGALSSAVALFAAEADDEFQLKLLRRCLQLIAITTLVIAMATLLVDSNLFLPRWPFLVFIALLLWLSSTKQDLRDWILSVHVAKADPAASHFDFGSTSDPHNESEDANVDPTPSTQSDPKASPWIHDLVDNVRMRQKRKRARQVLEREREEASDASRLDQVLQQVSEHGTKGLSDKDRALLQRVSDNLRRNRDSS